MVQCPIDTYKHDCAALECYMRWPKDYPFSPCDNCGQKRINELREKLEKDRGESNSRVINMSVIERIDELIVEAENEPTWTAVQALRCLRKELQKENEEETDS